MTLHGRDVRVLTEAKALSALAHPQRARIIDALRVDGPGTASQLADRTGQAVGSASHHLKVLAEAGLVVEAPELAKDRRERWWRVAQRGTSWSQADLLDDPAALAAAQEAEALGLRRQVERVHEFWANAEGMADWQDAAFATQSWLKLTPAELRELSAEVVALLDRWSERSDAAADDEGREPVLVFARGFPTRP